MNRVIARSMVAAVIRRWRADRYIPLEVKCSTLPRYKAYRMAAIYEVIK